MYSRVNNNYEYDAGERLVRLKDPFGFVENIDYGSKGRLTTQTFANGAKTIYTYNGAGQLTAFDNKDGAGGRLVKHSWTYDALHRKSDEFGSTLLDLTYESADGLRLTGEALNNSEWSRAYEYDAGGRLLRKYDEGTIDTGLLLYWQGLNVIAA